MELRSTLTCPHCGWHGTETMPTDACQYFYDCKGCGAVLRPTQGDCCVFCSYGSVPCPLIQQAQESGGAAAACCAECVPPAASETPVSSLRGDGSGKRDKGL